MPCGHLIIHPKDPPVVKAIKRGDKSAFRAYLENSPVDTRDSRGLTLLAIAAHENDRELAELLLAKGADPNAIFHADPPHIRQPRLRKRH